MLREDYFGIAPDALDALTPEERHNFYKMVRLRVVIYPNCDLEISWAGGEGIFFSTFVDLESATISVRRTLTKSGTHLLLGEPKTKKSRRTIHLTEVATEALRDHLQRQMEEMERLGDLYEDHGLVFTTQVGSLINPTNLRKRSFAALLKRAELPLVRFHDLRHTCATLLFSRGVHPKYVQELLGHANISITLDRYSHVIPGMGDHTARAMEDALS